MEAKTLDMSHVKWAYARDQNMCQSATSTVDQMIVWQVILWIFIKRIIIYDFDLEFDLTCMEIIRHSVLVKLMTNCYCYLKFDLTCIEIIRYSVLAKLVTNCYCDLDTQNKYKQNKRVFVKVQVQVKLFLLAKWWGEKSSKIIGKLWWYIKRIINSIFRKLHFHVIFISSCHVIWKNNRN